MAAAVSATFSVGLSIWAVGALGNGRRLGSFAGPVDALNALDSTPLTRRQMAGAPRLAAVTAQAGLLDTPPRQRKRPGVDVGIVVRAGESQALAIATAGARTVAPNLAEATDGTRHGRFLGTAVDGQGSGTVCGAGSARLGLRERRPGEAKGRHLGPGRRRRRVEVHHGD